MIKVEPDRDILELLERRMKRLMLEAIMDTFNDERRTFPNSRKGDPQMRYPLSNEPFGSIKRLVCCIVPQINLERIEQSGTV